MLSLKSLQLGFGSSEAVLRESLAHVAHDSGRRAGDQEEDPTQKPKRHAQMMNGFAQSDKSEANTKGGLAAAPRFNFRLLKWLDSLHVLGLPALGAFDHIELNLLTLLQAAESIALNCRMVDKNILAILTAKKAESLCIVEPLYYSLFHDFLVN